MESNNYIILDVLYQYFLSIGFHKKSKTIFIKKNNDGYWFINLIINCKNKEVKLSYQIGFHLYEIEKISANLKDKRYSLNSITGSCNIGHLFDPPIYYEQLIDLYVNEADILFDTSYHIDKYVNPILNKYNNLNLFKDSILSSKELNAFSVGFFNKIAFYITAHDFQNALNMINYSRNIFINEDDKNRCIFKIKDMEELF